MGMVVSVSGHVVRALGILAQTSLLVELAEKARAAAHILANVAAEAGAAIVGIFKSIAASSWAIAIAEAARAVWSGIAESVESLGFLAPAIAAAAIAGAAAVNAAFHVVNIPGMAEGGIVNVPTLALVGEREPEAIFPLSRFHELIHETTEPKVVNNYNYVTIQNPSFRDQNDLRYLTDRLKRMGEI